jgi:hypothetical protein
MVLATTRTEQLAAVAVEMIALLHWKDVELLVDLIFARSGWQRVSEIGGIQEDIDLILEQPATGDHTFVQVKSTADYAALREFVERCTGACDHMFFVCHKPQGELGRDDSNVDIGTRPAASRNGRQSRAIRLADREGSLTPRFA